MRNVNEIDNEYFTTSDVLDAQPPVFCIVYTAWSKVNHIFALSDD